MSNASRSPSDAELSTVAHGVKKEEGGSDELITYNRESKYSEELTGIL